MTDRDELLDELRPVSFAIAYQMLVSVSEAEDVVQARKRRWRGAGHSCITYRHAVLPRSRPLSNDSID